MYLDSKHLFITINLCFVCCLLYFYTTGNHVAHISSDSWLKYCATKRKVRGSFLGIVLDNFQAVYSSSLHLPGLRSTQLLTEMITKELPWDKMRRAHGTRSSSALVVTNVKERMEALHSILHVCHYDLLRESLILA